MALAIDGEESLQGSIDWSQARELMEGIVYNPDPQILLSREDRQLFYNQPERYLRERFTKTELFQEIYAIAQEVFYRAEPSTAVVTNLAGALFQAYGNIYVMQRYSQDGYSLLHDNSRRFDLYRVFHPDAAVRESAYEKSLQGVTISDALVVVHRGEDLPYIQHACEYTTSDRKGEIGHFEHSCMIFDLQRQKGGMGELFAPTSSLLYVVPKDFEINHGQSYPFVDVLHTPANNLQWRDFVDYVLFDYRPQGELLTLGERYEIANGQGLPKSNRRALLYPVDRIELEHDESPVAQLLADEGLDDRGWNGPIPGKSNPQ